MTTSTERGTSSRSARRSRSRRGWGFTLCLPLLLAAAPRPASGPALTGVEGSAGGKVYTLLCRGRVEHRILQEPGRGTVSIEMPGAAAELGPEELPAPEGPVQAISLGSSAEGARLDFSLRRPVSVALVEIEGGLRLRLDPIGEGDAAEGGMRPLGTEDLLEISVFEVADLNRTVRIGETGTLSLPLLGEIHAAGLTPRDLELRIRDLLEGGYVKDPHVSVFVREHGSKRVSVLGAVGKPGVYEMLGPRTLLQVIAQAGGLTRESGGRLYVIRSSPGGGNERIAVPIDDLMTSRDPALNLAIEPGDVVSVPPERIFRLYVDGAVRSPGMIEQPSSRPITLMQAIAHAGGATERANLKKVRILRKGPGGEQRSLPVNLQKVRAGEEPDPVLQDGDLVIVAETFF